MFYYHYIKVIADSKNMSTKEITSVLQKYFAAALEEGKKAGRSLYRYHAECCRSVAELHSNHNACKL